MLHICPKFPPFKKIPQFQFRIGNIPAMISTEGNPICFVTTLAQTATGFTVTSGCLNNANRGNFVVIRKKEGASQFIFDVSEFDAVLTGNLKVFLIKRPLNFGIILFWSNIRSREIFG